MRREEEADPAIALSKKKKKKKKRIPTMTPPLCPNEIFKVSPFRDRGRGDEGEPVEAPKHAEDQILGEVREPKNPRAQTRSKPLLRGRGALPMGALRRQKSLGAAFMSFEKIVFPLRQDSKVPGSSP